MLPNDITYINRRVKKYPNLKFEFLGNGITTKKEYRKFYYVFNDYEECYSTSKILSEQELSRKIKNLCYNLKGLNITPNLITISRSVKSGYTPIDIAKFVEDELIKKLRKLYDLDISTIDQITEKLLKNDVGNIKIQSL